MKLLLRLTSALVLCLASAACVEESEADHESRLGGDDDQVVCSALAPDCPDGGAPADTDGDGCALECAPVVCIDLWPDCPDGEAPTDTDDDGCALECAPVVVCPALAPDCPEGEVPMDLDGDGCALECGVFCGNSP